MAHLPVPYGDYPPLLPFGFHDTTAPALRDLCVNAFPRSTTRGVIMDKLEQVINAIEAARLSGELWVDGSFLTEKIDARDVDVVLHGTLAPGKVDLGNPGHVAAINWLGSNLKASHMCDSYTCLYVAADPNRARWRQYWQNTFGYSRGRLCKGIAVLILGTGI
jgi:hypothetical protein